MPTVAVIGSVNLDIVARVARLPAPGETVTGAKLHRFPGGKGANQALAADDAAADEALALLRAGGVDLSACVAIPDVATGTALIAVAPSGENQIVVAPGANRYLLPDQLEVPDSDAVICQLEVPVETVVSVAKAYKGFFCVNLAPAMEIDVAVLQRADLVVVNETESDWYGASLSACAGLVATTRGAGVASLERDGKVVAEARPTATEAIDATGAGDTFTAALTVALIEGQAPEEALQFACAAGAVAVTKMGAQPSLPMRSEVAIDG
jgi:ribokinase